MFADADDILALFADDDRPDALQLAVLLEALKLFCLSRGACLHTVANGLAQSAIQIENWTDKYKINEA